MTFAEVEERYRALKDRFTTGELSEADFKARLQDLMIEDDQGRWWIIGYETGQWYVSEGEQWTPAEPPRPAPEVPQVTEKPPAPVLQPLSAEGPGSRSAPKHGQGRSWFWIAAGIVGIVILALLIRQLNGGAGRPPSSRTTETFSVTSVALLVEPRSFTGNCPATFGFAASITTNAPGMITYQWERSDRADGPPTTMIFGAAESRTVNTAWTLGVPGTHWMRVHVLSPNDMVSNEAPFDLGCVSATGPVLFVDADDNPGRINRLDGEAVSTIYQRPNGQMHSVARASDGSIYFCDANGSKILRWRGEAEEVVFTHGTYVREVAIGPGDAVYFSEATGAGGDGIIYRLDGVSATEYYRVRLADVDGFWAGNFAFDPDGNLWLSSGNRVPASLYRVAEGTLRRVYTSPDAPIMGFTFEPTGNLVYADGREALIRLSSPTLDQQSRQPVPGARRLSDVASP